MSWLRMSNHLHSIPMLYSSPPTHSLKIQNHYMIPPSLLPRNYRTLNSCYVLYFQPPPTLPRHQKKKNDNQYLRIWIQGYWECNWLRWCHTRVESNPEWLIALQEEWNLNRDEEGKWWGDRDRGEAAISQGRPGLPEVSRVKEGSLPGEFGRSMSLPTPFRFQTFSLKNFERSDFHCLSNSARGPLLQQPKETKTVAIMNSLTYFRPSLPQGAPILQTILNALPHCRKF